MPILVVGAVAAFLLVWLIFYFIFARRKPEEAAQPDGFSLPVPHVDKSRVENLSAELLELGFSFFNNFEKENYGLWPSPVKLYAHQKVPAFAELSVFPTEEAQIQFITFFPGGSLTTTAGERQMTFRFFDDRDAENWEQGNLAAVWNAHQIYIREYEARSRRGPLPAVEEAYQDFLNFQKSRIHTLLKEEKLIPRTVTDYVLLGYFLLAEGKIMEGLEMFQGSINMDPDKAYLHRLAGRISLFVKNYEAATQYFYEVLDLDPLDKEGYHLLAESLLAQGKKRVAFEILKRGRENFPDDLAMSFKLGKVAVDLDELEEARANLVPLDGLTSPSHTLFQALANLYAKLGDQEKAKGYVRLSKVFAKQKDEWKDLPWARK